MGNARWSQTDWAKHTTKTQTQTREEIFTKQSLDESLDPKKIKFRESVDSQLNPNSTPIVLAADETGSMGELAEIIIKSGLGTIMESIYNKKPVSDPHICCMGVGDANCDQAPLQVTQFEAAVQPLVDQVKKIYIEGNGGGNGGESYPLAWWFSTYKTKHDAFVKRNKKGYLFTIGDESPHPLIKREHIRNFLGVGCECDVPTHELLKEAEKFWNIFHLIVKPVANQDVSGRWRDLLGERAIHVSDHTKLAEGIVSTIQLIEGQDADTVAKTWNDPVTVRVVKEITHQLLSK